MLTRSEEMLNSQNYLIQETSTRAKLADILKIHDLRYINSIKSSVRLSEIRDELVKFDRDSLISAHTWNAALLASGALTQACDQIMAGKARNAFCAIRPPGHHAGVFGKTFQNNVCDQE